MTGTEILDLWWLIPIIMIILCVFYSHSCCFGRRESREQKRSREQRGPPDPALRVLDRHYVSGVIDEEEY